MILFASILPVDGVTGKLPAQPLKSLDAGYGNGMGDTDMWVQKELELKPRPRGFHLITSEIVQQLPEMVTVKMGLLNILVRHTSASLTINENADPTVRQDFESFFNRTVPENQLYLHDDEGSDDMPAHLKASLLGATLTIPVTRGRLNLGTWQGIYLCEHRDHGGSRSLVLTLQGAE